MKPNLFDNPQAFPFSIQIGRCLSFAIISMVLLQALGFACVVGIPIARQELDNAEFVAEGIVIEPYGIIELTKSWKGKSEKLIYLDWIAAHLFDCIYWEPLQKGDLVMVAAQCPGRTSKDQDGSYSIIDCHSVAMNLKLYPEFKAYLEKPITVGRVEILALLRGFVKGSIPFQTVKSQLRLWNQSAKVNDWRPSDNGMYFVSLSDEFLSNFARVFSYEDNMPAWMSSSSSFSSKLLPQTLILLESPLEDTNCAIDEFDEIWYRWKDSLSNSEFVENLPSFHSNLH